MVTTTSRISFTTKELQLVLTTYFPTCSPPIYSLWALVFWSLSFLIRVEVLLDVNSFPWFTTYSSTFPFLVSSLWALFFWSLYFFRRAQVLLGIYTASLGLLFTLQLFLFSFSVPGLWSFGHCISLKG